MLHHEGHAAPVDVLEAVEVPLRTRYEELAEGLTLARDASVGVPQVVVVEPDDHSWLQPRRQVLEHRGRARVQVAVDVGDRDVPGLALAAQRRERGLGVTLAGGVRVPGAAATGASGIAPPAPPTAAPVARNGATPPCPRLGASPGC